MIDEEEFYATIKLKNGEEIFSKVSPSDEGDKVFLILEHPVTIKEIAIKNSNTGYKIEPWIKTSDQDIFLLSMNDVLTVSECFEDSYFIDIYLDYLKKSKSNRRNNKSSFKSRKMGYLSNVSDAKKILEKIYRDL